KTLPPQRNRSFRLMGFRLRKWAYNRCRATEFAPRMTQVAPPGPRATMLERRRNHLYLRHHPSVLMLEDVAMVDKLAKIRECDVDQDGRGDTVTASPLID